MSGPTLRAVAVEKVREMGVHDFAAYTFMLAMVVGGFAVGAGYLVWKLALLAFGCGP